MKAKSERQESDLALWLHNMGYNFFNMNALTHSEIGYLVDAWNREQKEKSKQHKSKKSKR